MARRYEGKVLFFGVAWRASEEESRAFIDEFEVPYDSGLDTDESIFRAYGFSYQPATVLVSRTGRVFMSRFGPISEKELEAQIDGLIELDAQRPENATASATPR